MFYLSFRSATQSVKYELVSLAHCLLSSCDNIRNLYNVFMMDYEFYSFTFTSLSNGWTVLSLSPTMISTAASTVLCIMNMTCNEK